MALHSVNGMYKVSHIMQNRCLRHPGKAAEYGPKNIAVKERTAIVVGHSVNGMPFCDNNLKDHIIF